MVYLKRDLGKLQYAADLNYREKSRSRSDSYDEFSNTLRLNGVVLHRVRAFNTARDITWTTPWPTARVKQSWRGVRSSRAVARRRRRNEKNRVKHSHGTSRFTWPPNVCAHRAAAAHFALFKWPFRHPISFLFFFFFFNSSAWHVLTMHTRHTPALLPYARPFTASRQYPVEPESGRSASRNLRPIPESWLVAQSVLLCEVASNRFELGVHCSHALVEFITCKLAQFIWIFNNMCLKMN